MNKVKYFAAVLFCVTFITSCADMFQNKVSMPTNIYGSAPSLYNLFSTEEVIENLNSPSEIIVSVYEYCDRIKITWSAVPGAASYCLERAVVTKRDANGDFAVPTENEFEAIEHTKSLYTNSYTDIIISDKPNDPLDYTNEKYNYAYFYRVCAENKRAGLDSSEYIVSSKALLLKPPKNIQASLGEYTEYIEIEWDEAEGATSYEVYRSFYSDGSNAMKIGTATLPRYNDSGAAAYAGQELYYKVYAVSSSGAKSVESPIALGYTLLPGAPARVADVAVTAGHGEVTDGDGISITWGEVVNTTNSNPIVYAIYRSSSRDSSLVKLGEVSSGNTYTDRKSLTPNTYYYYRIQAYFIMDDGTPNRGPMSKSGADSENPAEGFILSPPPYLTASKVLNDTSKTNVIFEPSIGDKNYSDNSGHHSFNEYEYVILGSASQIGPWSEVARVTSSSLDKDGANYIKPVDACAYYKMKTAFKGKESIETEVIAPAPYAVENVHVTRAEMVGPYSAYQITGTGEKEMSTESNANANGVHPVRITWAAPQGGAEGGYHIYRSTKYDSGFRKITDEPINELSYIDDYESAKAGIIYYYRVLSLNSLKQGANYSVVDKPIVENNFISLTEGRGYGWGALTLYQYMQEQRKTIVSSQKKLTLMHKSNNLDKVGSETINGDICGTLYYNSSVDMGSMSGVVTMPYTNYADSWIQDDPSLGIYFFFNGNTNTKANISANGQMNGTVTCKGMYPGRVRYDNVEIKGGAAAGGTYGVIRDGIDAGYQEIYWLAGN